MIDKYDAFLIVTKVLTWTLSVIAIYWLILKLTNHSPTEIQAIFVLVGVIFSAISGMFVLGVRFAMKVSKHMGKVEQCMKENNRRLGALEFELRRYIDKERS
jgi:hypothetical protein